MANTGCNYNYNLNCMHWLPLLINYNKNAVNNLFENTFLKTLHNCFHFSVGSRLRDYWQFFKDSHYFKLCYKHRYIDIYILQYFKFANSTALRMFVCEEFSNYMELSTTWEATSCAANSFPAFYGTRSLITAFTWALHSDLSWVRPI
jgi:hypothetical protein